MIQWQKSSYSGGGDGDECVEVALQEGTLLLRESDDSGRILPVTPQGPAALLGRLRVGRDG
ncbi:DUF397 domain-containing protein [Streptomyces rhizosphaerihabitans]|uniref:DUF397 domain-containing protein n=1 Tax=Streptomyces rhizosphaerihabitans TaxID=1266770 RepID=UPI0021BF3DE5|nr:DUF397 domain-containing protein [Streptomyces rhizosphaerihabitans]MCT9008157.1 DUF397 domain-containing protein [Streptomyces rhizosphaerihabitans]